MAADNIAPTDLGFLPKEQVQSSSGTELINPERRENALGISEERCQSSMSNLEPVKIMTHPDRTMPLERLQPIPVHNDKS